MDRGQRLADGVVRRAARPSRELLDQVTGGRPAYLTNRDGHGAWVSSRALELAGIDASTPDPPTAGSSASRRRLARRAPCTRAPPRWSARLVPALTLDDRLSGLLLAQQHLHARGITAWQDAIVGDYLGSPDPLPVYLAAAAGRAR